MQLAAICGGCRPVVSGALRIRGFCKGSEVGKVATVRVCGQVVLRKDAEASSGPMQGLLETAWHLKDGGELQAIHGGAGSLSVCNGSGASMRQVQTFEPIRQLEEMCGCGWAVLTL